MDRFLSASLSVPVSLYCLAAGCILIASKLTECDSVTADTLCAAAEYSFLPSNLLVSLFQSILQKIDEVRYLKIRAVEKQHSKSLSKIQILWPLILQIT